MNSKAAWLHFGPTFCYLQIRAGEKVLVTAKEPLYLGWQGCEPLEESQQEELLDQQLISWKQILDQYAVATVQITLSPALIDAPLLIILRHQLKNYGLPTPMVWSAMEEVQHLIRALPWSKSAVLLFGICENRLYLINMRTSQIEWHAALPLGLIELQRQYCQVGPAEQPNSVELRRQISIDLDLIQWHIPPQNVAIVSDVAILLAAKQQEYFVLTKTSLEKYLPILTKNPPRQACREFGIDSPLGLLLLPAALICQHILDYLQITEIATYPFELKG